MLFISGTDLESSAIKFIESHEKVTLFSAYLKLEELKKINRSNTISRIVVRWEIKDLCLGVSDLELYEYCETNKISLYRNTRLHLKAFWNNNESIIFGSANVTERGLGEVGNYNYELNGFVNEINLNTAVYLNSIILESEFVSYEVYNKIKDLVDTYNLLHEPEPEYPSLISHNIDPFLLSNLPMSESVESLFNAYQFANNLSNEEKTFAAHDLALYKIPMGLEEIEFYTYLRMKFNQHPFIISLKNMIIQHQSVRYGGVVRWIQENTTTVPTPRSWELKQEQIVNILYEWVCYFDKDFSWSRPNHSQVIFFKK